MPPPVISVAPMVDVTTRHFRYLLRLLSQHTTLWTPMLVAARLASKKRHAADRLLQFHPAEDGGGGRLVAQLGGDDPKTMLKAAARCAAAGYSEVNVNMGCPARSAKAGRHGAALMRPEAHDDAVELVRRLAGEVDVPVSVKLRIGVDEHDGFDFFEDFVLRLHEQARPISSILF